MDTWIEDRDLEMRGGSVFESVLPKFGTQKSAETEVAREDLKIAIYDEKDTFLTQDDEPENQDAYNLYVFNLRAGKLGDKQIVNIRKLRNNENL